MVPDIHLDRKSRIAVVVLLLLIVAAVLLPVGRYVVTKLQEKSQLLSRLADDEIVRLPGQSTILSPANSDARRIADWLKSGSAGEQRLQLGDDDFVASSATQTRRGSEQVAQLARILIAYRDVSVAVMYAPSDQDDTLQLEGARAARIRAELLRDGVKQDQVMVAPKTLESGHDVTDANSLTLVLSRRPAR